MPNFRGVRFTNAHETLLWASRAQGSRYTFNHHAMKALNEDKQMRSDWLLPVCGGRERLKENGRKAHPTQKPEALLYRVLLATSQPGDIVLDPFMGTGTTAIVARKLHRRFVGIEREEKYIRLATKRLAAVTPELFDESLFDVRDSRWRAPRLPFSALLEAGLLQPGQLLYFKADRDQAALVRPDGKLVLNGWEGSIHQVGHKLSGAPCNGWEHWYYETPEGELQAIDILRRRLSQP
jgi:modification methylase